MSDDLDELRAKAKAHQDYLDRNTKLFTVSDIAKRWGCSPTTVRMIAHAEMPYINIGQGLQRESRRYPPEGVYAYETNRLKRAG